jgi:hypothetical protein
MFIKCILSVPLEGLEDFAGQFPGLSPLPKHIFKKGPYSGKNEERTHKVILIYEVDGSRLVQAWGEISRQLDSLRCFPGFSISAHLLKMREGQTVHTMQNQREIVRALSI